MRETKLLPTNIAPVGRAALALAVGIALAGAGCKDSVGSTSRSAQPLIWKVPEGKGFDLGLPAVDGSAVYLEGDSGVAAFDQATGRKLWEPRLREGGHSRAILLREGRLYSAEVGVVRSYDAATGAVLWAHPFAGPSSPDQAVSAVDGAGVYVGTRDHRVLRLDPATGATAWEVDVGPDWPYQGMVVGLAVSGDTVYVAAKRNLSANGFDAAGVVVALRRSDGGEIWRYQTPGTRSDAFGAPVVAGSLLLVSDDYGNGLVALRRATGAQAWRFQGQAGYGGGYSAPVVAGDTVFKGSDDTHVYAVDLATGRQIWAGRTAASVLTIAVCGSTVLANDNDVEILARSTGKNLGHALRSTDTDFATSGMAVAGGRAFVAGTHHVYALRCD